MCSFIRESGQLSLYTRLGLITAYKETPEQICSLRIMGKHSAQGQELYRRGGHCSIASHILIIYTDIQNYTYNMEIYKYLH